MKNTARRNLGAKLGAGSEIMVVDAYGQPRCARVLWAARRRIGWRARDAPEVLSGRVWRRDEGITWVRGWTTAEALALRASVAL